MRLRWAGILVKVTLILVPGIPFVEGSAQVQDTQDREARIHQKMDRLRALIQQRQQSAYASVAGCNQQAIGAHFVIL